MQPKALPGLIILNLLPAFLLIVDSALVRFIPYYVATITPFFIWSLFNLSKKKEGEPVENIFTLFSTFLLLGLPFLVLASYPFTSFSIIMNVVLLLFGFSLPYWNKGLTWWWFTLGGSTPLPLGYAWLQQEGKTTNWKYNTNSLSQKVLPICFGIAYFGAILLKNQSPLTAVSLLKILAVFLVFNFAMMFGAEIQRIKSTR